MRGMLLKPGESPFVFTVCQVGAEPTLKEEMAVAEPDYRFAFSRPGFITFKKSTEGSGLPADFQFRSVFARAFGVSVGRLDSKNAPDAEAKLEQIRLFSQNLLEAFPQARGRWNLHLWERDRYPVGEEPLGFESQGLVGKAKHTFELYRASAEQPFAGFFAAGAGGKNDIATGGDFVLDIVIVEEDEWWIGYHQHHGFHSAYAGGRPGLKLPSEAPSRAYLKLAEALAWSSAPVWAGDQAVEIGSAPGGASYLLLERGLSVIGIDPAEMDPIIAKEFGDRFVHVQAQVNGVLRESLPEHIHWLLLDMNVPPSVSLFAVDRLAHRMSNSLLGMFLTIKLNQWQTAREIPKMLEHIRAMGMVRIRSIQLAANKQEVVIFGLTRKGVARADQKG